MSDMQIANYDLDQLLNSWLNDRTATNKRAFVDALNALLEDRSNITRQRNDALRRLDALLASQADGEAKS